MVDYRTILFEISDGVARLTLNRPERLNSFTVEMHQEVSDALGRIEGDGVRVMLLTGAGRGFCAGQDLADSSVTPGEGVDLSPTLRDLYNPLVSRIVALPFPVVCAVNGVAAGAGANIALAADIVIAARSAKFIQSFANIGLAPDSGGTWILPRLVGQARALGLALTGQPISADQAQDWGLIWKVVDDADLKADAEALVGRFATAPTQGLAATKSAIRSAMSRSFEEQLALECDLQGRLGQTADYQEGVAAFHAKRPAVFTGH